MRSSAMVTRKAQRGFSLLEMMVVILIMTVIMGVLFLSINDAQKTSSSEQTKMDMFQESREFLDQLTRDLRSAGYPNARNFAIDKSPQDADNAVGLVKVDKGDLWFEGDVNGAGQVSVIRYHLTNEGPNCPCLRRSETAKVQGDPVTGQGENDIVEVQLVSNDLAVNPIFTAYLPDGTPITHTVDFVNNSTEISQINSIKISLEVKSKYKDLKTGGTPVLTLISTAKINNCSQAHAGLVVSCQ